MRLALLSRAFQFVFGVELVSGIAGVLALFDDA
jgi:hypothetical protein